MTAPRWLRSSRRDAESRDRANDGAAWSRRVELMLTLTSVGIAVLALIFSVVAFRSTERVSGPLVSVAADHQVREDWSVNGEPVGSVIYQVMVLVNRGRTPIDIVRVYPLDANGVPIPGALYFSAKYCERAGHATIEPGSALPIVSRPEDEDAIPYAWEVVFATGTETVRLERTGTSSDPVQVADAYGVDAEELLRACEPSLVREGF